ncbi:MAG: 30S ribosomal protein S2 [Candidatus Micrarchaeia archaeon]
MPENDEKNDANEDEKTYAEDAASESKAKVRNKKQHAEESQESKGVDEQEANIEYAKYLEAGVQIGAMVRAPGMSKFIYKTREDGLQLLDLNKIVERIQIAAHMLARYNPENIIVTASRVYAIAPAKKFAEVTGAKAILGRVMPGVFTNPNREDYMEPEIVLISDPRNEKQAVKEASKMNVPVVALADTDNWIKSIDLVVPCNNKGRRSLALVYYSLAKEFLKAKGIIKSDSEFKYSPADFEAKIELKSR